MNEIYNVISYSNIFIYTYYDIDEKIYGQYIISDYRNDIKDIINRLGKVENQIGFRNLTFDYNALHYIIECREMLKSCNAQTICEKIYSYLKEIESKNILPISSNNRHMNQLDLCEFFGFLSGNKNIQLSDLRIVLNQPDVRIVESIYKVEDELLATRLTVEGQSNLKTIVKLYNLATGRCKDANYEGVNLISGRYELCKELNLTGMNENPMVFAVRYFTKIHNDFGGHDVFTLIENKQNNSKVFSLIDCIPEFATYKNSVFNNLVDKMSKTIVSENNQFNHILGFNGICLKFGIGGVHGCCKAGHYEPKDNEMIVDIDIISMYATIASSLHIRPRHTNEAFNDAIEYILDKRIKALSKNDSINKGVASILKKTLNYIYGKTKEENFQFYDPMYSAKVTIAAQLFMCKFLELIREKMPNAKLLMVNTDSVTFVIDKSQRNIIRDIYTELVKIIPNLRFKIKTYSDLYIKDINNYIGKTSCGIIAKGIFDYNLDLYKDNSARVIPMAVKCHLFDKEDIDTILDNSPIMDFMFKAKVQDGSLFYHSVEPGGLGTSTIRIQNPSRYIYSKDYKSSGKIEQIKDNRKTPLTESYPVTIMNYLLNNSVEINTMYYRSAIEDIINDIMFPNQELF